MKTILTVLFLIPISVGKLFAQGNEQFGINRWSEERKIEVSNMMAEQFELEVLSKKNIQNEQAKVFTLPANKENIKLSFSDGRDDATGLADINAVLQSVGVRVSTVELPEKAKPILETSKTRALNEEEAKNLIAAFHLDRAALLNQIEKAGREPAVENGGALTTGEDNMAPYPKVYDMKALSAEVTVFLQDKFGKLHVNSADDGLGIDEVMTIVSGGPWTWFFVLPDNVVGKLTLGHVKIDGLGWRISYPGLGPHGGFFDAKYGLVVAFAHGPEKFVMRYEDPGVKLDKWMGKNPWIDFSDNMPRLLEKIDQVSY
ncbi:hypothetical protein [uncultured Draconibacterium sp.]|uniref:hypothetical protein n=1 Tax=uncultured Draconibacterium sp. TaxID=1573823 RepID=UPI0029C70658|nr:hypothetical protein [uncultured Draconibacterium sp.]